MYADRSPKSYGRGVVIERAFIVCQPLLIPILMQLYQGWYLLNVVSSQLFSTMESDNHPWISMTGLNLCLRVFSPFNMS